MRRSASPAATAQSGRECCSRSAAARMTARPLSGFFSRCITSDSEETTAPVSVCSISMPLPLERHRSPTPASTGTRRTSQVAMTPCSSIEASMMAEQVGPSSARAARGRGPGKREDDAAACPADMLGNRRGRGCGGVTDELGHRGDRCRSAARQSFVGLEDLRVQGISCSVDRWHAGDDEASHVLEPDHVLGRVASVGARLMPRRAEAVAPVPRPQRGGGHAQPSGDDGNREARGDVSGLHRHILRGDPPYRISSPVDRADSGVARHVDQPMQRFVW